MHARIYYNSTGWMGKYNSKEMAERSFGLDIRGKIAK